MASGGTTVWGAETLERSVRGARRWLVGLPTLPGVLIAAAFAALLGGWLIAPQGYLVALLIGCVLLGGAVGPAGNLWGIQGRLSWTASRGVEGEPLLVQLDIRNQAPWPASCLGLSITPRLGAEPEVIVPRVPGWSNQRYPWSWTPLRRGCYPLTTPEFISDYPFGVRLARRKLETAGRMIVWPRTVDLPLPMAPSCRGWGRWLSSAKIGEEGETLGIRPFQQGDSLRAIHWPATSRWGELYVRERQRSVAVQALLIVEGPLDPWTEEVIRVVASLGRCWLRHQIPFRCEMPGWTSTWSAGSHAERKWLDGCAAWNAPSTDRQALRGTDEVTSHFATSSESLRVWIGVDATSGTQSRPARPRRSVAAGSTSDSRDVELHITAHPPASEAGGPIESRERLYLDPRHDVLAELAMKWPSLWRESVHVS